MTARYSRQTVLPEIGPQGQMLLGKARILVVGAGGLGAPALLYLTAAGVGRQEDGGCIGVIDDDTVDCSNLQRQIVFRESDQGTSKTDASVAHLAALNNETCLIAHRTRLTANNTLEILAEYDIIIDGSDNFATKYLINDAAVKLGKPVVFGSILGFEGQVSVFWNRYGPCYRCIYPEQVKAHIPNCAEAGTLGGIAGVIGSIQAVEACKLALGQEHCQQHGIEPLIGRLLIFDALSWDIRKLSYKRHAACPICTCASEDIKLTSSETPSCSAQPMKTISLPDLSELYNSGIPMTLIDVRELVEWDSGHLDGAQHIPLGTLINNDQKLDDIDPKNLVVVYCQQGIRSAQAVLYLRSKGYEALNLLLERAKINGALGRRVS